LLWNVILVSSLCFHKCNFYRYDEKKRAAKLERAVRAEKTRQDQAKYWAKYHEKEEKAKAKAKAVKQGGGGGEGGDEDTEAAEEDSEAA
jgi:hypothetical protein